MGKLFNTARHEPSQYYYRRTAAGHAGQLQTELAAWQQATHDEPLENLALV